MSILIIDDDAAIREVLCEILSDEGYAVLSAADGARALDMLRGLVELPKLILLDLMMPGMNGWEFRSQQQNDPRLAAIPVMIVSADSNVPQQARDLQATGYLQKPIALESLIAAAARVFTGHRATP